MAGILFSFGASAAAETEIDEKAWQQEPAFGKIIKVGYNGGLCLGTFGIAHIKGFYEAEGLKTEIVRMGTGGSSAQIEALGTGKVDVAGDHIATLMVPTVNGVRMKFTTGIHTGCKSIYVPANSDIQKTSDLIGKTIAVPDGIGASDQNITMRFLSHDKVDPMKVKYKVVDAGASVLAMQNGEIQAALLGDQFAKKFLDDGTLRIVRSLTFDEDFQKEACCIHAIHLDFYEKNPITALKLTKAHENASRWIMDNREEAVKILLDNNWASGDPKVVLEIFNTYNYDVSDQTTEDTLRSIIEDYKSFGFIDKNKDTEGIMKKIWDPMVSK